MKRRDLFKMFVTIAAMPLVAPLAAWCKSRSDGFTHVQRVTGMRVYEPPVDKRVYMSESSLRATAAYDPAKAVSYQEYSDAGRMPRYEGIVYTDKGNRMWRFDMVSIIGPPETFNFKCHVCGHVLAFNRDNFREHGKTCNFVLGEQS